MGKWSKGISVINRCTLREVQTTTQSIGCGVSPAALSWAYWLTCCLKKSAIQCIMGLSVAWKHFLSLYSEEKQRLHSHVSRLLISSETDCSFSSATLYPDCVENVRELVWWIWWRTCYGWLQECHFHNTERSFEYWAWRKKVSTCPSAPQILITSPPLWSTRVHLCNQPSSQMLSLQEG